MDVALLGFGKAGQSLFQELDNNFHVKNISIFDPKLPAGVATLSQPKKGIQFFENEFSFSRHYDLIVIATPDHLHQRYLLKCIELEIPTFVEKPLVSSREQLESTIQALLEKPNYQLTTNLILRASPLFEKLKQDFKNRKFGDKVFIEGKYLYGRWAKLEDGWRGNKTYSVILGGLIHLIDLACFITGNFDYEVSIEQKRLTSKEPIFVNDFAQVSMNSEATGFYSLTTNFSANVEHRRDFSIYGDSSWIEIKGESVEMGDGLRSSLTGLSPFPRSKGALLSNFISNLQGDNSENFSYPKIEQIVKVLNICLGQSTAIL